MSKLLFRMLNDVSLTRKVKSIEQDLEKAVEDVFSGDFWIYRYGEYKLDTSKLAFWICVKTDEKKSTLQAMPSLDQTFRGILSKNGYPQKSIPVVFLRIESQEQVDKQSSGNWYWHFK